MLRFLVKFVDVDADVENVAAQAKSLFASISITAVQHTLY